MSQHFDICSLTASGDERVDSLNYLSTSPALLVIPASPCWPCEPQASAVARWGLPLGDSQKSVLKSLYTAILFRGHSRCQIGSTSDHTLLTFSIAEGLWACISAEKAKTNMKWTLSFLLTHRTTQDRNLLTFLLLGPLSVGLIWFHFCWPGWKLKLETILQGAFKTLWSRKGAKVRAETHFHNYNFNLHIRRQFEFRLEMSHHGNQQMNSGQKVFVVDDWQANSREQNRHKKTTCTDKT